MKLTDLSQEDPEGLIKQYYAAVAFVEGWPGYWDPDALDRARKSIDDAKLAILAQLAQWQSTAELHAQETLAAQEVMRKAEDQRDAAVEWAEAQSAFIQEDNPSTYVVSRMESARLRYEQLVGKDKDHG